jgi:hypothetical protein
MGLSAKLLDFTTHEAAQRSPCAFGTFCIIKQRRNTQPPPDKQHKIQEYNEKIACLLLFLNLFFLRLTVVIVEARRITAAEKAGFLGLSKFSAIP